MFFLKKQKTKLLLSIEKELEFEVGIQLFRKNKDPNHVGCRLIFDKKQWKVRMKPQNHCGQKKSTKKIINDFWMHFIGFGDFHLKCIGHRKKKFQSKKNNKRKVT